MDGRSGTSTTTVLRSGQSERARPEQSLADAGVAAPQEGQNGYSVYDARAPSRGLAGPVYRPRHQRREEPSNGDHDRKLRDQLWFSGRAWFAAKDCCIPRSLIKTVEDEKLLDLLFMELSSATYVRMRTAGAWWSTNATRRSGLASRPIWRTASY